MIKNKDLNLQKLSKLHHNHLFFKIITPLLFIIKISSKIRNLNMLDLICKIYSILLFFLNL